MDFKPWSLLHFFCVPLHEAKHTYSFPKPPLPSWRKSRDKTTVTTIASWLPFQPHCQHQIDVDISLAHSADRSLSRTKKKRENYSKFLKISHIPKASSLYRFLYCRTNPSALPRLSVRLLPNSQYRKLKSQSVDAEVISVCSLISQALSLYSKPFSLAEHSNSFVFPDKSSFLCLHCEK